MSHSIRPAFDMAWTRAQRSAVLPLTNVTLMPVSAVNGSTTVLVMIRSYSPPLLANTSRPLLAS
jgi:hypothetical protein